jgi:hypothetical protein
MINIKGIDKAALLAALYNEARPLGMGFLQFNPAEMTREEAARYLETSTYFDYVKGRPLKVDLSGDEFRGDLYDRDQGHGHAAQIVERLRAKAVR